MDFGSTRDVLLRVDVPLMKYLVKRLGSQEQASLLQTLLQHGENGMKQGWLELSTKETSYAVATRAQVRKQEFEGSSEADVLSLILWVRAH